MNEINALSLSVSRAHIFQLINCYRKCVCMALVPRYFFFLRSAYSTMTHLVSREIASKQHSYTQTHAHFGPLLFSSFPIHSNITKWRNKQTKKKSIMNARFSTYIGDTQISRQNKIDLPMALRKCHCKWRSRVFPHSEPKLFVLFISCISFSFDSHLNCVWRNISDGMRIRIWIFLDFTQMCLWFWCKSDFGWILHRHSTHLMSVIFTILLLKFANFATKPILFQRSILISSSMADHTWTLSAI